MLVVIANRSDQIAQTVAARWASHTSVGLLTSADLSVSGWRIYPGVPKNTCAVVGGQTVPFESITGVLTRMPCIFEGELVQIIPADRAYVASEMTAFLLTWLTSLQCRVVNRPTPVCLSGPFWRQEQWINIAAQMGIPIQPVKRHAHLPSELPLEAEDSDPPLATVTVIGQDCLGMADKVLTEYARRLAAVAQVDLLAVQFSGPERGACLVGANTWPDLSAEGVEDTLLGYLQEKYPGGER